MKPVFMQFLFREKEISKLIYVDNDIAFFGEYGFLFKLLDEHNILLTPHFYERNPEENQNWLEANFRVGLFNAGFVGANNKTISTLEWWAKCCAYRCEKNYMRGLFDDQKYLDMFPVIEPTTKILDHQGCNLAGWNIGICRRTKKQGKERRERS
jgi:lipopolysaccharide biosynthesis glycosyltransferase